MPPRRCRCFWAASLALMVAAPSRLGSNAGASAPGSRTRLRGPRRATNASSALQLVQPGAASNEVVRRLPAPKALDDRRRRLIGYDQVAKLTASDAAADDGFGHSVAIAGDTVVIGARYDDDDGGSDSGSAYVLRTSDGGATYGQVAKLTASDAAADDQFGYSVAIAGDTIVVGTYRGEAAYVFRTSDGGATYGQVAKLTAADAAADDEFGFSVAIYGDTIVVGARYDDDSGSKSGSAYVFLTTDGGATYGQVAKLTAADGAANDRFGYSVAIAGDTVVVGAQGDDDDGSCSGSVYVFRTTDGGATYGQVTKLTASDAAADDYFGTSVAIDGSSRSTVVVGAYNDGNTGPLNYDGKGSAYVFHTSDGGATYGQVAKLTADDAAADDQFSYSVGIDGDTIVAGAGQWNNGGSGVAYVFRTTDGGATYGQVAKLTAADGAATDFVLAVPGQPLASRWSLLLRPRARLKRVASRRLPGVVRSRSAGGQLHQRVCWQRL